MGQAQKWHNVISATTHWSKQVTLQGSQGHIAEELVEGVTWLHPSLENATYYHW